MKISAYIMIVFGISVSLYLLGYTPVFMALAGQVGTSQPITATLFNSLIAIFTNPIFLIGLAVAGLTGFLSGGNFSVIYVIPLLMIISIANIFVLPTSYLLMLDIPLVIQLIINTLLNTMLMLSIVEFIRGG
jgi:hypothetical protein